MQELETVLHKFIDYATTFFMLALLAGAVIVLIISHNPFVQLYLSYYYYSPHAYEILIWPCAYFLVLRRVYGWKAVFFFMFWYGGSEIWNNIMYVILNPHPIANIAWWPNIPGYWYKNLAWLSSCVIGGLVLKPRLRFGKSEHVFFEIWLFPILFVLMWVAVIVLALTNVLPYRAPNDSSQLANSLVLNVRNIVGNILLIGAGVSTWESV